MRTTDWMEKISVNIRNAIHESSGPSHPVSVSSSGNKKCSFEVAYKPVVLRIHSHCIKDAREYIR